MPFDVDSKGSERPVRDLTCREVVELITVYLEGALDARERIEVADHLRACGDCSTYLEQMRQTVAWLRQLPVDGVTPEVKGHLLERFRQWCADKA